MPFTKINNTNTDSALITSQTEKTSLVDADKFLITDSASSNAFKYVQKSNLPSGGLVAVGQVDSGGNTGDIYIDNVFSATYKNYLVIIDRMNPATDGANIGFRLRDDTPSSISDSNYDYNSRAWRSSDNTVYLAANDDVTSVLLSDGGISNTSSRLGLKMAMWVHNPFESTVNTSGHGTLMYINTSAISLGGYMHFNYKNNASARGFHFFANTGNINGRIKIYGVVDS